MNKQSYKHTVDRNVGDTLIALTHERNLPFDIQVRESSEDGDLQLLVTFNSIEDLELYNQTLCNIINDLP